jgi:hypothetical protein
MGRARDIANVLSSSTNIALDSELGLSLITPTSITVTGGSGSISTGGGVSFTSASAVSLNGCFSATYDNYKILIDLTGSTTDGAAIRLRASGTDSTSSYSRQYVYADNTSPLYGRVTSQSSWGAIDFTSTTRSSVSYDIFNPFLTRATSMSGIANTKYPTAQTIPINAYGHDAGNSYDGLSLIPGSGTITGSIRVYGYRN